MDQALMLAAVGPMQVEVAAHRMAGEFGAAIDLSVLCHKLARLTDEQGERALRGWSDTEVLHRADGVRYALLWQ